MLTICLTVAGGGGVLGQDRPIAEQGYAGLTLRDIPGGYTVVSWLFPGPLDGADLESRTYDLARPDLVVSVNGRPMSADEWRDFVPAQSPGDVVRLEVRTARNRGSSIPDEPDHEEEVRVVEFTLDSRDTWLGTMQRGRGHDTVADLPAPPLLDPADTDNVLGAALAANDLAEPLTALTGVFTEWQDRYDDYHALSRVRAGFEHPLRLAEIQALVTAELEGVKAEPPGQALEAMRRNLDAREPDPVGVVAVLPPVRTDAEARVARALLFAEPYVGPLSLPGVPRDAAFAERCLRLLRVPRESFYLAGDDTLGHVEVIKHSMSVHFGNLVQGLAHLTEIAAAVDEGMFEDLEPGPPAEAVAPAIEGAVLSTWFVEGIGWVVIGSAEDNRYDTARIAVVIDPGGDDVYEASGLRLGARVIVDLGGDDLYTGTPDQGPGAALLGASFIDDRAGNDRYEGEMLSTAAAMFGASLLLDRAGDDTYAGSEWSIGAACYGAAMLVDLGRGGDTYLGDFLCQGVGGPRGFGCIVDENGRDLYRANGPTTSAYGTPAVYQSFSQGVGFGFRHYAAGGIGVISDLGGNDRYEAGEFAQGGAYYFALGILHDARGRDLYYGNRYAQGFGVHQAIGVLADDAGDDTYWSMTAASQGAGWDIGAGLLIDRGGNDAYQCDGLGQGGASMQALGMLIDLGGADRYAAAGGAVQGKSGGDWYHHFETGAFSFSLLLDRGGAHDWYSSGRADGATVSTGRLQEERPQDSTFHGLFIDE
jgi:hypothetical protein